MFQSTLIVPCLQAYGSLLEGMSEFIQEKNCLWPIDCMSALYFKLPFYDKFDSLMLSAFIYCFTYVLKKLACIMS